jgi:hypothetical protein
MNSETTAATPGASRCGAAAILSPYQTWIEHGWSTGQRNRPPAKFLFRCGVPVMQPPPDQSREIFAAGRRPTLQRTLRSGFGK